MTVPFRCGLWVTTMTKKLWPLIDLISHSSVKPPWRDLQRQLSQSEFSITIGKSSLKLNIRSDGILPMLVFLWDWCNWRFLWRALNLAIEIHYQGIYKSILIKWHFKHHLTTSISERNLPLMNSWFVLSKVLLHYI